MATRLKHLRIEEGSLCETGMNKEARVVLFKAMWSAAMVNDLPDSCFAVISPGGKKDESGKTVPRSLRHLPYKDAAGKVDLPHLRNALARLEQTAIPANQKAQARRVLQAAAENAGVGKEGGKMSVLDKFTEFLTGLSKDSAEETETEEGEAMAEEEKKEEVAEEAAEETTSEEATEEVTEEVAEEVTEEMATEDTLKAMPEAVQKMVADLKKQLDEATAIAKAERDQRIAKEYQAEATEFATVGTADDIAKMLQVIDGSDKELGEKTREVLKGAKARISLSEIGSEGEGSDADGRLDQMAKEKAKKDGTTFEKAYSEILKTDEGKKIYTERSVQ